MESLQVRTGQISLQILDDYGEVRGVFKFNPQDIESAKRVFALQAELPAKQAEFEARIETVTDDNDKMEVLSDIVDYFNNAIDDCFGKGSSAVLFGGAKTLSMYEDFFEGILPYYQKASEKRVGKYKKRGK